MLNEVFGVAELRPPLVGAVWYERLDGMGSMSYPVFDAFLKMWAEAPTPASGRKRWLVNDHDSLLSTMGLEDYVTTRGLPDHAPPEVHRELSGYVSSWRAALPFSEAERDLVLDAYRSLDDQPPEVDLPRLVRQESMSVVDTGLRRIVKGRDLMRRWWAWRREMDEFAGQGGLGQAKEALRELVNTLVPPHKMPYVYYDLQGLEIPNVDESL